MASLRKQTSFKPDSVERKTLDNLRLIATKDAESTIANLKSSNTVITPTVIVDVVLGLILTEQRRRSFPPSKGRFASVLNSFKQHEKECFSNLICRLALVQTQGHVLNPIELSNQLLQKGYACLEDVNLFGLIIDQRTAHQQLEYMDLAASNSYRFIHVTVQHFLAAINLLNLPVMDIFSFLKHYVLAQHNPEVTKNCSIVTRFFFGMASNILGDGAVVLLQNVLKFFMQYMNKDAPVVDSRVALLILNCLYEAQNVSLYRQVQNEIFVRQIFSFNVQTIEENMDAFAHYLSNTNETKQWTIYCAHKQKGTQMKQKVSEIKGVSITVKVGSKLTSSDTHRIIISNKNFDYWSSVFVDVSMDSPRQSLTHEQDLSISAGMSTQLTLSNKSIVSIPSDSSLSSASYMEGVPSANSSDFLYGPYGYLTKEQFETEKKAHTSFYYNMVKDLAIPNLRMHCATPVRTQYRKNDHIWFSFPQTMRNNFYECVQITPVVPMHWVKVPQPDGTVELEDRMREKARSVQPNVPPSSNKVAEVVVLNSHRLERIAITPPSGGDPVLITLYTDSELSDNGEIGCDYLMENYQAQEEVKWRKIDGFDIKVDEQIGRELPLPSKKGTESAREKAELVVQPNVPPSSNEVAEVVVLNSHRLECIAITPPSGGDPVLITLYADSELSDNGEIGCDYLMENYQAQEEVKWRKIDGFDIKVDEQIGRELPLPSKKGTESAREKAELVVQPNVPPSSNEVAEVVVLNSHRLERIAITPPSGGDPVLITLYTDSELSDNGEIGCDYLMENYQAQEEVKWRKIDGFDIKVDEQIGRELPLPSKKGTESAREKAELVVQPNVPPSSNEVAEVVVLNSHRLERIAITPPSGGDPVLITLYADSELSDNGEIGCDYLMENYQAQEEVEGFDELIIGRELPLPSKKGTESAEITASTAMANLKDTAGVTSRPPGQTAVPSPRGPYNEQILGRTKLFARPLCEGPDPHVTEQQIKRWAMEGFDRPGYCFYGDGDLFQIGYEYTLPEQLPHTRTLREGGNGTVLEVYYKGTFYAVKRTAFRWCEVLIMPKLRHKNILRLVSMMMGGPMKEYPRRRYVFQYFPRMTNDLGRSIGSYERYCLRTLNERYCTEVLPLSRIRDNFKYVAREVLQALNYLHTLPSPIVHRDVKPSNILVKSDCACANVLVCVCRKRPMIVLSDFDASLELSSEGELIPDSTHSRSQSYFTTQERLYHISPVGTIGFKSPEGFMHVVSNSLEVLPNLTTKADIFSFGLLMVLLYINEDGPRHLSQVGKLLLSLNSSADEEGRLPTRKMEILKRSGISPLHKEHIRVTDRDKDKVLPIKQLEKDFRDMPEIISFVKKALTVDSIERPTAQQLLDDKYLEVYF